MKTYLLNREQFINKPLQKVFSFFERPENLAQITPPALGFKILTPSPITMKEGTLIDYTVKILGIPQRWTSLITTYQPPLKFVDEQLKGPYSFWHHTHYFKEVNNGTIIIDEVRYGIRFGILGEIVHALIVKRQLKNIFDFRERKITQIFESLD